MRKSMCAFFKEKPTSETQKRIWLENGTLSKPTFVCLYHTNSLRFTRPTLLGGRNVQKTFFVGIWFFQCSYHPSGSYFQILVTLRGMMFFPYLYDNLSDFQISYVCITRIRFASPGRICWAHEMLEKLFLLEFDFFNAVIALRAATLKFSSL